MKLWDQEIAPLKEAVNQMPLPERLAVAVKVVDFTLQSEPSPIEDEEAAQWVTEALDHVRGAVDAGAEFSPLPEELVEDYEDLQESVEEYGVPQLMIGVVSAFAEGRNEPRHGLKASDLSFLFESCYNFALLRLDPEPQSLRDEENSERCREIVAYQKDLITQAAR